MENNITFNMIKNNVPVLRASNRSLPGYTEETNGKWMQPFYFIQAADTQFSLIDRYILHLPEPKWDKEIELTRQAVAAVNKMKPKPKFFIVCGDLVDAFPEVEPEIRAQQEADFMKVFCDLDPSIPLLCVCGNHDIGDRPTVTAVERYRNVFGDDYFSFWIDGVFFLVINSQYYEDRSLVEALAQEQDTWLDNQLATSAKKAHHVIIFQHIPWFLHSPDEPKEYFNIEVALRTRMLSKFRDAGVKAIFCGHYHQNAEGKFQTMDVVTTSAIGAQLGNDGHGFRIVRVREDAISHQYYTLSNVPEEIEL